MEYYVGTLAVSSDIYHHGIMGQKWGVRNGPPYPLSPTSKSSNEKPEEDRRAKIEKGKRIAKRVLLIGGAVAIAVAAGYTLTANGSSIDIFDEDVFELAKSLEKLPYGGKLEQKHWDKKGRLVLPRQEYARVMSEIKTHETLRLKRQIAYPHYSSTGIYIVRNTKSKDPEIVEWFLTMDEATDALKELF